MKANKLVLVSILALGATVSAQQPAPTSEFKTVEVVGEAPIHKDNVTRARETAMANARRAAVEQVAGVMVTSDTLTANSTLIADRIYANSVGYVRNEQLLSETANAGVLTVKMKVDVASTQLDKDLQAVVALIRRLGKPRMLIVLQENTIHGNQTSTGSGVAATVLTQAFKADGWTIIDPDAASGKLRLAASVASANHQLEAKDLGEIEKLNVDYVLKGAVVLRNQVNDEMVTKNMFLVTGEYDFSVFETRGRQQIGKVSGELALDIKKLRPEDARKLKLLVSYESTAFQLVNLRKQQMVSGVRDAIIEHLRNSEVNGARMVLVVDGLSTFAAVQRFQRVLAEQITGVREVNRRTFAKGRAEFDLQFTGSSETLAEQFGTRTFDKKAVSVVGLAPDKLELAIAK